MEEQERRGFGIPTGWWDHYFVRYFVGTVVGAGIFLYIADRLVCQSTLADKSFVRALIQNPKDLSFQGLTGIIALGLAYCYVASAPMMILHATRAQLFGKDHRCTWRYWVFLAATVLCFLVLGIFVLCDNTRRCFSFGPLACVLIPQILLGTLAHSHSFDLIKVFYNDLGIARSYELRGSDYVDSYRHLREHSNAFSIIALEFVFAFVLLSVPPSPGNLAIVVVLWVLPAGFCWLIATVLENAFTYPRRGHP
jgi:hypothetical protein